MVVEWVGDHWNINYLRSNAGDYEDENFISHLVLSDEATFHFSLIVFVNRHNVRIWKTDHQHETV